MLNLRSGIKSKALNYFFLNEDKSIYINELARLIGADPMNLYRSLIKLEEEGLLKSEFRGKERYFSSNKKNPLYKNYKEIFLKTHGFEAMLKEALEKVKGLEEAIIYGSYVAGGFDSYSDIDIMAVGSHSAIELNRALSVLQKETGRELNAVSYGRADYEKRKKKKDPFICGVLKNKKIKIIC
ncbi:MAG: nucleotidyltransferase domain-containing protein [Candidatus Saganbacteria bacterium]|nr:nucleotidyltransferase domain-containing protein [Candidatus Saganbacteria bacterium]